VGAHSGGLVVGLPTPVEVEDQRFARGAAGVERMNSAGGGRPDHRLEVGSDLRLVQQRQPGECGAHIGDAVVRVDAGRLEPVAVEGDPVKGVAQQRQQLDVLQPGKLRRCPPLPLRQLAQAGERPPRQKPLVEGLNQMSNHPWVHGRGVTRGRTGTFSDPRRESDTPRVWSDCLSVVGAGRIR